MLNDQEMQEKDNNSYQQELKDKDIVNETIRLYRLYSGGDRETWQTEVNEDIEFVNNAQYSLEDKLALEEKNIPAVVYNVIKPTRDQAIQQLTQNDPQFLAIARENSDTQLAADITDLMSYIWDKSNGRQHFIKAVENFEDGGLFCLQTYYDPFADWGKGDIKIRHIDLRDIYIDPRSTMRNAQDAENIFLAYIMSEEQIQRQYPGFDLQGVATYQGKIRYKGSNRSSDLGQVFEGEFIPDGHYYLCIDRYRKIKVPMFRISDPNTSIERLLTEEQYIEYANEEALIVSKIGDQKAIIDKKEILDWKLRISQYRTNIFHLMTDGNWYPGTENIGHTLASPDGQLVVPIPNSTVQVEITNKARLLNEGLLQWEKVFVDRIEETLVIGDKLYGKKILPISKYPFGITMLHHTDSPFPYGDARLAKPIQEQINKARSLITAYHTNIASLKVFVPEGTDLKKLEKNWGKAGAQFFTYDPSVGVPIVVQLQQMSNILLQQTQEDKYLIQRIYGVYEFQDGAANVAPQTKGGTVLLDEYGQRRSYYKRIYIEQALNDLAEVISEMIPEVYTQEKVIRIIRPNSTPKEVYFNVRENDTILNDLTSNRYDIKLVSGSTLTSTRGARLETAIALWDRGILKTEEPILRLTDLPEIDKILAENSTISQAQQMLEQLQQTVKELQGDMQTSKRELTNAEIRIEKEKAKAKLNQLLSELKAGVNLAQMRMNDQTKQIKKEVSNNKSRKDRK